MEEILASIRKIISEDQPDAAKPAPAPAPAVAAACLEAGLVVNAVTPTALRFAPSLLVTDDEIAMAPLSQETDGKAIGEPITDRFVRQPKSLRQKSEKKSI